MSPTIKPPTYHPYDQLTGLPARQTFIDALEVLLTETRTGYVALGSIDIDRFVTVNHGDGWFVADRLLLDLADVLKAHVPEPGCVMRQADAFLFAMTATELAGLQSFGAELQRHVQPALDRATSPAVLHELSRLPTPRTGLSATVALLSAELPGRYTFDRLTAGVDQAMLEGKAAGGGRVVVREL
jgi:GGDEF domain-containing protein